MTAVENTETIHLPAGLRYECIRCGRSCGEFWEIPVEPDVADRLGRLPPEAFAGARNPERPTVENPWTPGTRIMRSEGGRCCLQTAEGLCSLHTTHGLGAKPAICQSFPFRFARTPDGVYTGLSFACTAVLHNAGPELTAQGEEAWEVYNRTGDRLAGRFDDTGAGAPIALADDIPLSWPQYRAIEEDLADMLDPAHGPIGRRLIMQSVYLRLLINFLRPAREQAGAMLAGPEANEEPLAVFRKRMRGTPQDPWPLQRALAGKRRASPLLRRMFLGFAHSLRNTYGQRRGRARSYWMTVSTYFFYAAGRGTLALPALRRPVRYRKFSRVRFNPVRPDFDELLTRYFRHRLFRKDLLLGDSIQSVHHQMLLHWGLIAWYAQALAATGGAGNLALNGKDGLDPARLDLEPAGEVGYAHLAEAIRNVEKYFVFHSTLDHLFARIPMLRGFLDRLFAHPLYAFSMGYGENE